MSYSERYHANIPFSGSVPYSYPASEHGGTGVAHYSGAVPVNVTINVNTGPFDGSVKKFNNSVDVLSGSVVAMKAAQCAAIQKTAAEVSTSVINGFFGTIKTELSQQLQALDSAIKATLGLLMQQGRAVTEQKDAMEGDYNRVSSRYIRLFADLDNECHKRIYTLDKQSFTLSEKVQKELLSESSVNTAAMNLLGIEEVSSSKTLVFISSLNRKALDVLQTLHNYITQESKLNSLVNSLLSNEVTDGNIPFFVPVVWTESDKPEDGNVRHENFIPDCVQQGKQAITEKTDSFCTGVSQSEWRAVEKSGREALNREFNALAESCFTDSDDETEQRIYKTMLSLWQNSNLLSL